MEITLGGLGATCCTAAQTADPTFAIGPNGDYAWTSSMPTGMVCDPNCLTLPTGSGSDFSGSVMPGSGSIPNSALPCCTGVQLGPLYANLPSGNIRYRISDTGDYCDPNCLGVPAGGFQTPFTTTSGMNTTLLIAAALGILALVMVTR